MNDERSERPRFSRRRFLHTAALAGGLALTASLGLLSRRRPEAPPPLASKPTEEQIEYIRTNTKDPVEVTLHGFKSGAKLVGLGESHDDGRMRILAAKIIDQAASQGLLQFVALEHHPDDQRLVDNFLQSGLSHPELIEKFAIEGVEMLKAIRKHQLQVLCVDQGEDGNFKNWRETAESRDILMKKLILDHMQQYPDQNGLFYAGSLHTIKGPTETLSHQIGDQYYSVIQQNQTDTDIVWAAAAQTGITTPIGLNQLDHSPFANTPFRKYNQPWAIYGKITNGIILHPNDPNFKSIYDQAQETIKPK